MAAAVGAASRSPRIQAVAGRPLPLTRYQARPSRCAASWITTARPPAALPTTRASSSGLARRFTLAEPATLTVVPGASARERAAGAGGDGSVAGLAAALDARGSGLDVSGGLGGLAAAMAGTAVTGGSAAATAAGGTLLP